MSAHTPGPWIASGTNVHANGGDKFLIVDIGMDQHIVELTEADARLIASSPDLLAALKNIITAYRLPNECVHASEPEICDGCRYATEIAMRAALKIAAAAIAKSEGRLDTHPSSERQRAR